MNTTALDSFIHKWLQRWPQWPILEYFIETPQREISVAWFSLLQEYEDIFNITGDPTAADAKLAWWVQELHDWSRQRSRHPLGKILQPLSAPWSTLADALPKLINARKQANDCQHARVLLHFFACCVTEIENALFHPQSNQINELELEPASQTIISQLLAHRSQRIGAAAMPLAFNQLHSWQHTLLDQWPIHRHNPRPRRLYASLSRLHLQAQLSKKVHSVHPLHVLWHGWRAARQ